MASYGQVHFWRPDKTLLRSELNDYFSSGYLADIQVICGRRVFNVHKLVLAAASEYILNMFNQVEEIDQINLSDYNERDVEAFVNDLYEVPNIPDSKADYLNILDLLKIKPKESGEVDLHDYFKSAVKEEVNGFYFECEGGDNLENQIDPTYDDKPSVPKVKDKTKYPKQKYSKLAEVHDTETNCIKVYRERSKKLLGIKTFNQDEELEEAISGIEYKYEGNVKVLEKRNEKQKKGKKGRPRKDPSKGLTALMIRERNRVKYRLSLQVTCMECGEVKKNKTELLEHHKLFHKVKKPNPRDKLTCPTCGKSVEWRNFEYHVAKHDPDADLTKFERFECDKCGKKFQYGHLQKKHVCEKVSSYFIDNEDRIICTLCLHVFNDLKEVLPHKQENHMQAFEMNLNKNKDPIFECPVADCFERLTNISKVKKHLQYTHFCVKKYKCTECDEKFTISHNMKKHRQDVHGLGADLQCENCGENFFAQSRLDQHIYLKHSEDKNHLCPHCPKRFKMKNHLRRHMFTHTQISNFECEQCGKKFRDKATLGYHINTHTGEKPYKCPYCPYGAASYPVLHLHKIKCPYANAQLQLSYATTEETNS